MLNKLVTYLIGLAAVAAFAFLVKLMYDMTVQMTRMTEQVTRMATQMESLVADVHGMAGSVDRMSGVLQQGGQQMQQLNPTEMMRGMVPGQRQR